MLNAATKLFLYFKEEFEMSTNALIGIEEKDGSVKTIYCHFDGYLTWVGRILLESYNTEDRVHELLSLGDISSLGESTEPSMAVSEYGFDYVADKRFQALDKPTQNMMKGENHFHVTAYHRDRGEAWDDVKPVTYPSIDQIEKREFTYVFVPEKGWLVDYPNYDGYALKNSGFVPLTQELINKEK